MLHLNRVTHRDLPRKAPGSKPDEGTQNADPILTRPLFLCISLYAGQKSEKPHPRS